MAKRLMEGLVAALRRWWTQPDQGPTMGGNRWEAQSLPERERPLCGMPECACRGALS